MSELLIFMHALLPLAVWCKEKEVMQQQRLLACKHGAKKKKEKVHKIAHTHEIHLTLEEK